MGAPPIISFRFCAPSDLLAAVLHVNVEVLTNIVHLRMKGEVVDELHWVVHSGNAFPCSGSCTVLGKGCGCKVVGSLGHSSRPSSHTLTMVAVVVVAAVVMFVLVILVMIRRLPVG